MLFSVILCFCSADATTLTLVKASFILPQDMTVRGNMHVTGTLLDLSSISAVITQMSIVAQSSALAPLLKGSNCALKVASCNFIDLRCPFGSFSQGSVMVQSCSFNQCVRPITMAAPESGQEYEEKHFDVTSGALTVVDSTFTRCTSSVEGGAIKYSASTAMLNLTRCVFNACTSSKQYGGAVFSQSSNKQVVFDYCQVINCESEISVIHLQCGSPAGDFGELSMRGSEFVGSTISQHNEGGKGGGSGLVIRFPTTLRLIDCVFQDCTSSATLKGGGALFFLTSSSASSIFYFENCRFNNTQTEKSGGAISIESDGPTYSVEIVDSHFEGNRCANNNDNKGGSLYFAGTVSSLSLSSVSFLTTIANEGGCIHADSVESFNVAGCVIDGCGTQGNGGYSLYVGTPSASLREMTVKNMPGGRGKLKIKGFTDSTLLLYNCSFSSNFGTGYLLECEHKNPITLNLTWCVITSLANTGADQGLLQVQRTDDGLYVANCRFESMSLPRALLRSSTDVTGATCVFLDVTIKDVDVTGGYLMDLSCFTSLDFTDIDFVTTSKTAYSIMRLANSATYLSLSSVKFNGYKATNEDSSFMMLESGHIVTFEGCEFISCTSTSRHIVYISQSVKLECPIKNCVFRSCKPSGHILYAMQSLTVEGCTFEQLSLTWPCIRADSIQTLTLNSTKFDTVILTNDLVKLQQPQEWELTIDNINIMSSSFASMVTLSSPGKRFSMTRSTYSANTITNALVSLTTTASQASASMVDCQFRLCNSSASNLVILKGFGDIEVNTIVFEQCSAVGPLLQSSSETIAFSDCCFQGSEANSEGATYVNSTSKQASFAADMCFDLDQVSSVDFGDLHPWDALSANIFECESCSWLPTSEEEPETSADIDPDTSTHQTDTDEDSDSGKLGAGAIAGIVIAVLVVVAVVIIVVVLLLLRKKEKTTSVDEEEEPRGEMKEESFTEATLPTNSVISGMSWDQKVTEDNPVFTTTGPVQDDFSNIFEEDVY